MHACMHACIQESATVTLTADCNRRERTGFPEVVWGPGKTPLQIVTIMCKLAEEDQLAVASRVEPEVRSPVCDSAFPACVSGGLPSLSCPAIASRTCMRCVKWN